MDFLFKINWEALILACFFAFIYYTLRTKIPLIPTQKAARKVILNVLREEMKMRASQKTKIYDLGAGLGGLSLAIAKEFPDAEVVGLEMGWPIWLIAFLRQKLSPRRNARFLLRNFWNVDISDGAIVVCYLGDVVMRELGEKLRREAHPGRLFVSNTFPLPKDAWTPIQTIPVSAWLSKTIYVYKEGLGVGG